MKWGFPASAPNSRILQDMVLIISVSGLMFFANRVLHQYVLNASLIAAVERGDAAGVEDLLRSGANANAAKPWFHSVPPRSDEWYWFRENVSDGGNAPEPVLCVAAEKRNLVIVDILLAHGAKVDARSHHDYTALFYASGDAALPQDLLQHGANRNTRDVFGDFALPAVIPAAMHSNKPKLGMNK